jgi:hypothetical protein
LINRKVWTLFRSLATIETFFGEEGRKKATEKQANNAKLELEQIGKQILANATEIKCG